MPDFFEAIRANPDDDATRLVWADALEEQGDPRHEYLRSEVAFRRLREEAPRFSAAWECVLLNAMPHKIGCIKAVRQLTGLGLKDAKDLVDLAPHAVQRALTVREAIAAVRWLERVPGCRAEARFASGAPTPLEAAWLQLYELSTRLEAAGYSEWMRAISRLVSIFVDRELDEETLRALDDRLAHGHLQRLYLDRAWRRPFTGLTLHEGLERNAAREALALFPEGHTPRLSPTRCFFDWPAGC